MTIDPKTLPDGTVAHISDGDGVVDISLVSLWDGGTRYSYRAEGCGGWSVQGHTITRVFVPVPDGMTLADAEAALADAGAWVEALADDDIPSGARTRKEWRFMEGGGHYYVHRDDLPPTDPDAEVIEVMAEAMCNENHEHGWTNARPETADKFRRRARAALAALREHEAKS